MMDDERPLRVIAYGDQFIALDDPEGVGFSASGHGCLQTLAGRLLAAGFDPDRPLIIFRANERIGKMTIAQAAQMNRDSE